MKDFDVINLPSRNGALLGFSISLCFWQLEQLAVAAMRSVLMRGPTLQLVPRVHPCLLGYDKCMILTKHWGGHGQSLTDSH